MAKSATPNMQTGAWSGSAPEPKITISGPISLIESLRGQGGGGGGARFRQGGPAPNVPRGGQPANGMGAPPSLAQLRQHVQACMQTNHNQYTQTQAQLKQLNAQLKALESQGQFVGGYQEAPYAPQQQGRRRNKQRELQTA